MPLVHMADMLVHAYRHGYAVGAFGVVTLDFLEAIIKAAENYRAPVILNLTESHFDYYDFELLVPAVVAAARRATIPVAIHLDHGKSHESAERAIRCGCSGVMVDLSELPFGENLQHTREITAMAHNCGVAVEGELGYVPGGEGENAESHPHEGAFTSPSEAKVFVARTGVDCLAVSIGTVHGRMKGTPKLDYARLAKINEAVGIPLVIHGGTGLSDEQFRKLIANGVAKINYYTALSDLAVQHVRNNLDIGDSGYMALKRSIRDAVRNEVERCIRLWGSGGRAAEVLEQCRIPREVEHVVLFNVLDKLSAEEVASMMRQGSEALKAIPGVRSVMPGKALQPDGKYRHCWLVRFASKEVAEHYRDHPAHMRFIDKVLRPVVVEQLTLDYEETNNIARI